MSIFYKMKCEVVFQRMSFNGSYISVQEVKSEILRKNRFGKSNDFDLQLSNAYTKEVFKDSELILKNTSVLYARVPKVVKKRSQKIWSNNNRHDQNENDSFKYTNPDFSGLESDTEKIDAMIYQSTVDYRAVNYSNNEVHRQMRPNYICRKCHRPGHLYNDCPLGEERRPIKKSSGIPMAFMEPVAGPEVEGAMLTSDGTYARRRTDAASSSSQQHVHGQRRTATKPY